MREHKLGASEPLARSFEEESFTAVVRAFAICPYKLTVSSKSKNRMAEQADSGWHGMKQLRWQSVGSIGGLLETWDWYLKKVVMYEVHRPRKVAVEADGEGYGSIAAGAYEALRIFSILL